MSKNADIVSLYSVSLCQATRQTGPSAFSVQRECTEGQQ